MKKFLLAAGCVAMMASAVSAKDYVISNPMDKTAFTESTYQLDGKDKYEFTGTWKAEDGTIFNVSIKQNKSTSGKNTDVFQAAHVRWYQDAQLTITAPATVGNIKKVVLTTAYADKTAPFTVEGNKGTCTPDTENKTVTWTDAEGVNPLVATADKQIRFSKVVISDEVGDTPVNPDPTPDPDPTPADPKAIYASDFATDNSGFTFEDGTMPEGLSYVWTRDSKYNYMKASGYYKKAYAIDAAYLVSPVLDLTQRENITLTFNQVLGHISADEATAAFTLRVREEGATEWGDKLAIPAWPAAPAEGNFTKFETSGEISLEAYKGKKIQLGWCYSSTEEKAGTWEIDRVVVNGDSTVAISEIEADTNAPVEYFNLQGVRVENPANGLYIMRQGSKAVKVIL